MKQANHLNESILNSAAEGICGIDLNGKTTFCNPAAAKMIGYEREEVLGEKQHQLIHHSNPDGSPLAEGDCRIYATIRDGISHQADNEVFWRKDGTSFPVEYASHPILEGEKITGAVITFNDITERKELLAKLSRYQEDLELLVEKRTEELNESKRALSTLIENLPGMAYRGKNDKDRTMEFVGGAYEALTGYSRDELELNGKKSFADIIHADDYEKMKAALRGALSNRRAFQVVYRIITKSGAVKWVWEQGRGKFGSNGKLSLLMKTDPL